MTTLIVHEWLTNLAGSERVVADIRAVFPDAPVATTMRFGEEFRDWNVITSRLQRFATGPSTHVKCLPLMPPAWRMLELPKADRVVSSFHTFALWAQVPEDAEHIVYCHTPPRFLWAREQMGPRGNAAFRAALVAVGPAGRALDRRRAQSRRARWLANSAFTARRLERAYGVEAEVVHPLVEAPASIPGGFTAPDDGNPYYLILGRLVPYKRVDLAVDAFRSLDARLVIAGSGRGAAALRAHAPENVEFLGPVSEAHKYRLLADAQALIFPGEEDLGLVPMEALSVGTPVIAFSGGGVRESMRGPGDGLLFDVQSAEAIVDAVRRFERGPRLRPGPWVPDRAGFAKAFR